jgi:hypothetical protein
MMMVNSRSNYIIYSLFLITSYGQAQPFPKSPEPWREEYSIVLDSFSFSHPMTVINRDELATVKEKIQNNIEPQVSAFQDLISEANVQLGFAPDAPDSMYIMGGYEPNSNLSEMRDWLWRNCHAAYTCGLAYALTDETRYADKALEVIMDWANTFTTFTGGDRGLQLGSWFSQMLYAADLIWKSQSFSVIDKEQLRKWIRIKWLDEGDVLDVMRRKDNNWKDAGMLGVMTASVILEDTLLLKEGLVQLRSYFFNRTDDYVTIKGPHWKIRKDYKGIYLLREVVRNDGSSGLTYTAYALTTMSQCLEIARYAGYNYWHETTEDGASIQDVIEQYYAWDILNEPFPWHTSPKKITKRRNCYELVNTHFELSEEMKKWIKNNRPLMGREGDEYITLTKGTAITLTSIEDHDRSMLAGLSLDQNYPNPFSPITRISFNLPVRNHTRLSIYNSTGQLVAVLVDREIETGTHTITFDASDLPFGIYVCQLQSGMFTEVKKMMYIGTLK